ncbi:MAG TPA: threonine/serine exporter family protein [Candidatus Limnocylindrales bacterium]|nr:threonine/serine exporter family protein [Candidatus Limnocylindrales bacterium]
MAQPAEAIAAEPPEGASVAEAAEPTRILRVAMRIAVSMLANGAQTNDVEDAIGAVARAYGVESVQAAVSFSMVSVSHYAGRATSPTTLLHLVRDRTPDFTRLSRVSELARGIRAGSVDIAAAEAALDRIDAGRTPYRDAVAFFAPGLSAAGSTVMFGGTLLDALATLGIGLAIQPILLLLNRSTLQPFFRLAIGAAASAILVAALAYLGAQISSGLVLTGSLLRFLPGYALVSGFRDLIDGSIVSGTARLAEALMLGAAIAGGTALALSLATAVNVNLSIVTIGLTDWSLPISVTASLLAIGAYAVQLGVPQQAVAQGAIAGAVAWLLYQSTAGPGETLDKSAATLVATILIGAIGRVLARRVGAPSAIWVVPAILPFLPGLQLVQAMLAETDTARINGLLGAAATAFLIGVGVAAGDIVVMLVRGVGRGVRPAVGAVTGGVDVLVIQPVGRVVAHRLGSSAHAGASAPLEGPADREEAAKRETGP